MRANYKIKHCIKPKVYNLSEVILFISCEWYISFLILCVMHRNTCWVMQWWLLNLDTLLCTCRNRKSESCPFCRGSLRRVNSEDLWVLTCNEDVVDAETVSKEDLLRFYLYVSSLPKDYPDALFLMYYEYLIWFFHIMMKNHVQKNESQAANVNTAGWWWEISLDISALFW